jgi:hypothetical protein
MADDWVAGFLQKIAAAANDHEVAAVCLIYEDLIKALPPRERERVLAEAEDARG